MPADESAGTELAPGLPSESPAVTLSEHDRELSFNTGTVEVPPPPSTILCPQAEAGPGEVLVFFACQTSLDPPFGSVSRLVPQGDDALTVAFAQMFDGPSPEESGQGFGNNAFGDIPMPSVDYLDGTVIINFESWDSQEVSAQTLLSSRSLMAAILQTGGQFGQVEVLLDGKPLSSYDDEAQGS